MTLWRYPVFIEVLRKTRKVLSRDKYAHNGAREWSTPMVLYRLHQVQFSFWTPGPTEKESEVCLLMLSVSPSGNQQE